MMMSLEPIKRFIMIVPLPLTGRLPFTRYWSRSSGWLRIGLFERPLRHYLDEGGEMSL